jgi:hypothetical protein
MLECGNTIAIRAKPMQRAGLVKEWLRGWLGEFFHLSCDPVLIKMIANSINQSFFYEILQDKAYDKLKPIAIKHRILLCFIAFCNVLLFFAMFYSF